MQFLQNLCLWVLSYLWLLWILCQPDQLRWAWKRCVLSGEAEAAHSPASKQATLRKELSSRRAAAAVCGVDPSRGVGAAHSLVLLSWCCVWLREAVHAPLRPSTEHLVVSRGAYASAGVLRKGKTLLFLFLFFITNLRVFISNMYCWMPNIKKT